MSEVEFRALARMITIDHQEVDRGKGIDKLPGKSLVHADFPGKRSQVGLKLFTQRSLGFGLGVSLAAAGLPGSIKRIDRMQMARAQPASDAIRAFAFPTADFHHGRVRGKLVGGSEKAMYAFRR